MAQYGSQDRQHGSAPIRRAAHEGTETADTPAAHPMLTLQRQIGNAQIARMLAQRDALPEEEEAIQARHDMAQREGMPEEEEEAIQARHDMAQREGMPEEEEEAIQARHDMAQRHTEEDEIQASPEVGLEGGPVSDGLASQINAQRGQGSALDSGMRASMESSLGTDLSGVRVHTGQEADSLNRSISAKAFTTGNDIFLRKDSSASDTNLMAHELTHVVQQRSMPASGGGMQVGPAGDSYEQHADTVASAVSNGQSVAPQRKPDEQ